MMRGINHQNIFEDAEDYYQFITTLDRMRTLYDDNGLPCGTSCTYYAYCLMSNHFHLLIREREESVGETVKRIASSYVYYYNRKYGRDGHLFKERFKSEPAFQICDVKTVLNRIPFRDLEEWVNDPLDDDVQCLEIEKPVFSKPSDDQVWMLIKELVGVTNSTAFQQLADETKRNILKQLKDSGASHRQLERLTGVGRGLIQKL